MSTKHSAWPMHFAAKPLRSRRLVLAQGAPFPLQDRNVIRGYGAAFGCPDAATRPWSSLPFVITLDVGTEEMAKRIREQGLGVAEVQKLVKQQQSQPAATAA